MTLRSQEGYDASMTDNVLGYATFAPAYSSFTHVMNTCHGRGSELSAREDQLTLQLVVWDVFNRV